MVNFPATVGYLPSPWGYYGPSPNWSQAQVALPKPSVSAQPLQNDQYVSPKAPEEPSKKTVVTKRRVISPQEQKEVDVGLSRWFPRPFSSYLTPVPELLAHPFKFALLSALFMGGLIVTPGLIIARNRGASSMGIFIATLLTLGAGVVGYCHRKQANENIMEMLPFLTAHPTKWDLLADPVYQAEISRSATFKTSAIEILTTIAATGILSSMLSFKMGKR